MVKRGGIQFFFNKGRDRKKRWDGVIMGGGIKKIYKTFAISLKETQTFKTHKTESYKYCIIIVGSNTKTSKTHRLINKMLLCLSALICLLQRVLPSPFSAADFFCSWTQYSAKLRRILNSSAFWFENGFLQLSLARYYYLHKKLCLQ